MIRYVLHQYTLRRGEVIPMISKYVLCLRRVVPVMIRYDLRRYTLPLYTLHPNTLPRYSLRRREVMPTMSRPVLSLQGVSRVNVLANWTWVW